MPRGRPSDDPNTHLSTLLSSHPELADVALQACCAHLDRKRVSLAPEIETWFVAWLRTLPNGERIVADRKAVLANKNKVDQFLSEPIHLAETDKEADRLQHMTLEDATDDEPLARLDGIDLHMENG